MLLVICNVFVKVFIKNFLIVFSVLWLWNRCVVCRMGRKMIFWKVNVDLCIDVVFDEMCDVDYYKGFLLFYNIGIKF